MGEPRWSEPFLAMLEALRMPAQFQAGRRDLRAGHVRTLRISSSLATASVRDDDGHTYRTRVAVRAFAPSDWRRIERALTQQAIHVARMLSGQLPADLNRLLADLGLSLFPQDLPEIAMDCTCLGRVVPCRHLTATCYALADAFDQDPFSILAWRGRGREELLERLRVARLEPEPRPGAGFWTAGPRLIPPAGLADGAPHRPDALLDHLGPLDLAVGRYQVTDLLRRAYAAMATPPRPAADGG
jgi:uncharacterized Zn finger protein